MKQKIDIKLQSFPEEITEEGIKIYSEASYENQILHNIINE